MHVLNKTKPKLDAVMIHKIMLAVLDALAMAGAFYLSFTLRNLFFAERGGVYTPNVRHAIFLAGLIPLLVGYFRYSYLYRPLAMRRSMEHLELISRSWLVFFGFFLALIFFMRIQLFWEHRITMFFFLILGWIFLSFGRLYLIPGLINLTRLYDRKPSQVLCLTGAAEARRIRDVIIRESLSNQHVIGYLDGDSPDIPDAPPRLGSVADAEDILARYPVSEVFMRLHPVDYNRSIGLIKELMGRGIRLRIALDQFGALSERVPQLPEAEYGYIFINESPLYRMEIRIKLFMDWLCAAVGLLVLSPLFLLIAGLIRLESPGPVFFRQKRGGHGGKDFEVFKFRTMRQNTEEHHKEAVRRLVNKEYDSFGAASQGAGLLKLTDQSQVTRTGAFLRKTSLDELPQLINVLRGEMSLVGPRPLPLYETGLFQPWQQFRHSVRPGITGFWQVFGRSAVSHEDTILMDIFYIMNWSLALDLRILTRTIFVLMTGKGAL